MRLNSKVVGSLVLTLVALVALYLVGMRLPYGMVVYWFGFFLLMKPWMKLSWSMSLLAGAVASSLSLLWPVVIGYRTPVDNTILIVAPILGVILLAVIALRWRKNRTLSRSS